jgi:hypothetical protein
MLVDGISTLAGLPQVVETASLMPSTGIKTSKWVTQG